MCNAGLTVSNTTLGGSSRLEHLAKFTFRQFSKRETVLKKFCFNTEHSFYITVKASNGNNFS